MEFRILGPLEVVANGRALQLGGQKQRALLARLLLEANRVVSADRLIEALWEETPPDTAGKALQVHVSQLRKVLGRDRLGTSPPGYVLAVEENELDVVRFRRLRDEGRPHEALALWRGPALAGFEYERFAQPEIDRLEELRLACLEERIDQDLAAGRHADLAGEVETLVRAHPLRERLRYQLMLCLYRTGRQAEALQAYQEARSTLVEGLGIEPGRALRDLHQEILNQDPALDLAVAEAATAAPVAEKPPAPRPAYETAARDTRKTVTAIAVALSIASTAGETVDPETLRRLTNEALAVIDAAVERHGGTVETVTADAVTSVFGLPVLHEDDALRALRSAVATREELAALARSLAAEQTLALEFRLGVGTGEVVAGAGSGSQLRATGEPLRLSALLARGAEPGEILFDDRTRRLTRDAVEAEPAGEAWRLVKVAAAPAPRRLVSPIVGRGRERRRLHDAFAQAVGDGSCQLFTVLGTAGVGKSRLVQEVLAELPPETLVARGRCLPYGDGITFWPLLEAVYEAVGVEDADSRDEIVGRLAEALGGEPDAVLIARHLAETIGLAEAGSATEDSFAAVESFFEVLARTHPLVLVFDDLHWGESTFLDLVEHVTERSRGAPILLVCLARPELLEARPGWGGGKLNSTSVLLEPLSPAECGRLIENLVGEAGPADEVRDLVAEAAEGNPLFVEEMVSMLIDEGLLVREGGRWAATGDLASVPVPPTIQALLAARLDQLSAEERAVIERAAIEGQVFHQGSVEALADEPLRPLVGRQLEGLVRKELVRPYRSDFSDERAYRFRHLLIRDAAYDSIPKAKRAELHELYGRWLEERTGDRTTGYEEIVGHHLEQAHRYRSELGPPDDRTRALARDAGELLGAAGKRAFVRRDAEAAVSLMSRAVALLPPDDPSRVDLVPNVRVVQGLSGDLGWADQVLTQAVAAAADSGDRRLEAHALVQRAFLRLFTDPDVTPGELFDVAEPAIAVFEESSDEFGLSRAWRLKAQAHYLDRRAGPSSEAFERALQHARRTGDRLEQRESLEWLCVALILGPTPADEAAARCEALLADVEHDPILEPTVLAVLANVEAMRGNAERAAELLTRWRTAVSELGESVFLFAITFGWVELAGDPVAAESDLRPGYEALKRMGEKSHFSSITALLARAVCAQGRGDEAERLSRESEEAARPNDIHSHILWRTARAESLAQRGDLVAAEALAREAVEFAGASDFLDSHGDALVVLAEVLELTGRRTDAARALEEAASLYEQKGNVVSAAGTFARLEEPA